MGVKYSVMFFLFLLIIITSDCMDQGICLSRDQFIQSLDLVLDAVSFLDFGSKMNCKKVCVLWNKAISDIVLCRYHSAMNVEQYSKAMVHFSKLYSQKLCNEELVRLLMHSNDKCANYKERLQALSFFRSKDTLADVVHLYGGNCIKYSIVVFTALCKNNMPLVRLCLDRGVDINAKSKDGNTVLHCAVQCNMLECVEYLLKHSKVTVLAKNDKGQIPRMIDVIPTFSGMHRNREAILERLEAAEKSLCGKI